MKPVGNSWWLDGWMVLIETNVGRTDGVDVRRERGQRPCLLPAYISVFSKSIILSILCVFVSEAQIR